MVQSAIAEAVATQEKRLLQETGRRLEEGYAVATGPQEVLDALRNGLVNYVTLGPDPGQVASRCTGCHSTFAAIAATCPYCQALCEKTNLWQQILLLALRHNVAVHFITADAQLARYGGVAAVLSRED